MKLRNKKTGEIGNLKPYGEDGRIWVWIGNKSEAEYRYGSLAELNEEWEDYEEPKVAYFINAQGGVCRFSDTVYDDWTEEEQIGNKFKTEEEAEKAVEKLRAWKRLEDKGIFTYIDHLSFKAQEGSINFEFSRNLTPEDMKEADKDLDLLFGGEE